MKRLLAALLALMMLLTMTSCAAPDAAETDDKLTLVAFNVGKADALLLTSGDTAYLIDKIEGSYGYYIIQYTSDVVEGAVDMETVHDTISSSLLSSKQSTVRDEVVAQWVKDANATINKDILND